MLNLEQVPFNIIEERVQNPRSLDERETEREKESTCVIVMPVAW